MSTNTRNTLSYKSIIHSLQEDNIHQSIDIDGFIERENIHLHHQDLFQKQPTTTISLEEIVEHHKENSDPIETRILVNTYIELTNSMSDKKAELVAAHNQVKDYLSTTTAIIDTIHNESLIKT